MGVGAGLSMYVVVVQKFTFAISSPDEFLFMNVEQLFHVYKLPTDLKALLIRPYLNDKADVAGDYSRLKDALLHEFKFPPNTYLERFNR